MYNDYNKTTNKMAHNIIPMNIIVISFIGLYYE